MVSLADEDIVSDRHKKNTNLDAGLRIDRKNTKPQQITKQNSKDTAAEIASAISQGLEEIINR